MHFHDLKTIPFQMMYDKYCSFLGWGVLKNKPLLWVSLQHYQLNWTSFSLFHLVFLLHFSPAFIHSVECRHLEFGNVTVNWSSAGRLNQKSSFLINSSHFDLQLIGKTTSVLHKSWNLSKFLPGLVFILFCYLYSF